MPFDERYKYITRIVKNHGITVAGDRMGIGRLQFPITGSKLDFNNGFSCGEAQRNLDAGLYKGLGQLNNYPPPYIFFFPPSCFA